MTKSTVWGQFGWAVVQVALLVAIAFQMWQSHGTHESIVKSAKVTAQAPEIMVGELDDTFVTCAATAAGGLDCDWDHPASSAALPYADGGGVDGG